MNPIARRAALAVAAPLAVLALASCGSSNPSITSADAQSSCEHSFGSDTNLLTSQQRTSFCKCILPALGNAGFKTFNDAQTAVNNKDPRVGPIAAQCIQQVGISPSQVTGTDTNGASTDTTGAGTDTSGGATGTTGAGTDTSGGATDTTGAGTDTSGGATQGGATQGGTDTSGSTT